MKFRNLIKSALFILLFCLSFANVSAQTKSIDNITAEKQYNGDIKVTFSTSNFYNPECKVDLFIGSTFIAYKPATKGSTQNFFYTFFENLDTNKQLKIQVKCKESFENQYNISSPEYTVSEFQPYAILQPLEIYADQNVNKVDTAKSYILTNFPAFCTFSLDKNRDFSNPLIKQIELLPKESKSRLNYSFYFLSDDITFNDLKFNNNEIFYITGNCIYEKEDKMITLPILQTSSFYVKNQYSGDYNLVYSTNIKTIEQQQSAQIIEQIKANYEYNGDIHIQFRLTNVPYKVVEGSQFYQPIPNCTAYLLKKDNYINGYRQITSSSTFYIDLYQIDYKNSSLGNFIFKNFGTIHTYLADLPINEKLYTQVICKNNYSSEIKSDIVEIKPFQPKIIMQTFEAEVHEENNTVDTKVFFTSNTPANCSSKIWQKNNLQIANTKINSLLNDNEYKKYRWTPTYYNFQGYSDIKRFENTRDYHFSIQTTCKLNNTNNEISLATDTITKASKDITIPGGVLVIYEKPHPLKFIYSSSQNQNQQTQTPSQTNQQQNTQPKQPEQQKQTPKNRIDRLLSNDFSAIAEILNVKRNIEKERFLKAKYIDKLQKTEKFVKFEDALTKFITYGIDENTAKLGAGQRAAAFYSFMSAFNRLPESIVDLDDIIKIANGRWPIQKSITAENRAKKEFVKIYKREPDMTNPFDSNAVIIIAYGLQPKAIYRNLNSEKFAIQTFKHIYKRKPKDALDWDIVRAIAYSGAKR